MHSLIIGGTRGMGRCLVEYFARGGHNVSVIGRSESNELADKLPDVKHFSVDITETEHLNICLEKIFQSQGLITNIVFSQRYRGESDNWKGELDTSLTATKNIIEYLAEHDLVDDGGSIVVVISAASSLIATEQPVGYHVVKAGLEQMVKYYAVNLGGKGIRVNSISPGTVIKDESREYYHSNHELHSLYKKITPLGRMGVSQDIANAVALLCDPRASFITGQNVRVDGGISLLLQASLATQLASTDKNN